MRLEKVDLNLFVVMDAIYRERGVTRVAQQLNLTQPAVSNALGRLRQTFDDQLFVRTPEGMMPTPVADSVIGDVRKALALLGRSVGAGARFDPATSEKVFRLGMNDLSQTLLLPGLLRALREQAPQIAVNSYYQDRNAAVEELKAGTLDLLLDAPELNARELGQRPLIEYDYVVAMRPRHPLANGPLSLQAYLGAEHLHVSSRRRGRGQVDVALNAMGHQRTIALRVQNYLVAAGVAADSDLLWTVPRVLAEKESLHIAELPFPVPPLALNLYWARSAADDPANQWMRELIAGLL